MNEPRRPPPTRTWRRRLVDRVGLYREQTRLRRKLPAPDGAPRLGSDGPSAVAVGAVVFVAVAATLGGLWTWQVWSLRSNPPVDDLMPLLEASVSDVVDGADGATDAAPTGGDGVRVVDPTNVIIAGPPTDAAADTSSAEFGQGEILVHVSGAVRHPGVVRVPAGSRVFQAVEHAGGVTPSADPDRVNLAAVVSDGQRVHLPEVGEEVMPVPIAVGDAVGSSDDGSAAININTATARELEELPGVGPATAATIVRLRDERGPYLTVEELLDVPGIGEAKLALLAPHVVVTP